LLSWLSFEANTYLALIGSAIFVVKHLLMLRIKMKLKEMRTAIQEAIAKSVCSFCGGDVEAETLAWQLGHHVW
jgi:hypothetical protein